MQIFYRRAGLEDWETISNLEKSVDNDFYKSITGEEEVKKYIQKSKVFILQLGDEPVGTISYEEKSKDHAYLDGLTVHPQYQGKGCASKAVKWLLSKLNDYGKIDLVTHPYNTAAIVVYLKNGFRIVGWENDHFGDGEPRLKLEYEVGV